MGEQGAEFMDVEAPRPLVAVEGIQRFTPIIDRFPTTTIESEVNDGTKRNVEVHTLLLNSPQVFGLVWEMSMYEPIVYARKGDRAAVGILSPNFDEYGVNRLNTIKVLPLRTPYPLVAKGADLLPDVQMAIMLAGSAHAEGQGNGGHDKPPELDYEHKMTFLGAISLGRDTITQDGKHIQHAERRRTSVATGLTSGSLGNLYAPDGDRMGGFTGYDIPLTFQEGSVQSTDAIFIPKGFLHNEQAYGTHYVDASRVVYGAGLQILYQRQGQRAVSDQIKQIAGSS
jgi:hypothetical protein